MFSSLDFSPLSAENGYKRVNGGGCLRDFIKLVCRVLNFTIFNNPGCRCIKNNQFLLESKGLPCLH